MTNFVNHNIYTRQSNNLHLPMVSLTSYQQEVHYADMKYFSKLPLEI